MQKKEISLVDLIIEMLVHWRIMLLGMLIGGMILGGLSYLQSCYKVQNQRKIEEKKDLAGSLVKSEDELKAEQELLKKKLTEKQAANIDRVLLNEQMYQDKIHYGESSIIMQIDPNNVQREGLIFKITSDDIEKTYNIERVYEDLITSESLSEWLNDRYENSGSELSEIIWLGRGSENLLLGCDTFRISIVHYDEAMCREIADSVVKYMNQQHDELEEDLGQHDLQLLKQAFSVVTDTNISAKQKSYLNDVITMQTEIAKVKDEFSDEEKQYYNIVAGGKEIESSDIENSSDEKEPATPQISVKHVILGIILALLIYMFVIFAKYVFNNKLRMIDNLQELYNIPQLGRIPDKTAGKRFLGIIDKKISDLRNRGQRKFSTEEALKLAGVAVRMAMKKEGIKTVCLIGCDLQEQSKDVCDKICKMLDHETVNIKILNNVIYDSEAMSELSDTEGVILVEKIQSTLYHEIVLELELLKRQDIKVLGGILIE